MQQIESKSSYILYSGNLSWEEMFESLVSLFSDEIIAIFEYCIHSFIFC